uniref:sphingomyelin phosphodiesterase n=1 Tax=Gallus gallus TaxID=9031 RepID=A0A8V0X599_CHICK
MGPHCAAGNAAPMLPTPLFPTRAVAALNAVAQALLFPAAFTLNLLLDLRPTTAQRRLRCRWVDVAARAALGSLLAVLLLLAMPAAVVGLLLWLPAQRARRPFAYSCWVPEGPAMPWDGRRRREFTFVSANVCLLPSGLAKFSNLGQTGSRARFLASSLVPQCPTDRQPLVGSGDAKGWGYGGTRTERRGDGGAATEIPRDPKEGLRVTPKEPSEDNRREAVIDMAGDGVKGTPWAPTTTHTPWGGVKDTSKDPTVDTPMGKDTPWNPSKATPRHRDPPMDEDTPWDPSRATPMDKATPWDPTSATPMDKATPWDPTRAVPMDKDTPWDPTSTTPMDKATPWDPTSATPMDKDTPWDPTRVAPMDKATRWDPTRAAPMDKDTPKDSTSATPRHRDPLQPTFLGSSPQLWERFPPDADFVCLQEVFDPMAEAVLCRQLGLRYPHVFHGVGAGGLHDGGLKLLGSGLLVAARYPPLAASFYCYPNGAGEDALAAKGLLCIQVLLGSQDGRRVLGYLSCTHLQAPERDTAVRSEQLRAALRWGRHFREQHTNTGDVVAFDVLCGDLNFDNCSHGG